MPPTFRLPSLNCLHNRDLTPISNQAFKPHNFSSLLPIHRVRHSLAEFGLQINAPSEARILIHYFSLLVTQRIWQWVASEDNSKHLFSHSGKRKEAAGRELLPVRYDSLYQQFCQHHPLLMALLSVG